MFRFLGHAPIPMSDNQPSSDPLQRPVAPGTIVLSLPEEEEVAGRIGRYKLLQKLGEGGCGVVFLAEQEEPVKRRVALKIIKLGMDTRQVVARFEAERQALAMMDHPNIAKVLDAGATEAGRPYFVMELVRGVRITDYCDQNKLGARQRLEIFVSVCSAIQHAHQKGIIHRDIKPSNILVTLHDGAPVPKVIDFGIAKATQQSLTDKTLFTEMQQFIGTPAYMSPEQAELSGLDIDTRSDIYSLGVLLYELLAGRPPFDPRELMKSGLDELRRRIREDEPERPSTKLTGLLPPELAEIATLRHAAAPDLIGILRGDLDWIVMKCLEKDRVRRYDSADALMADILRYLRQEPIAARPPSRIYRLQKLVRRNKMAVAACAAVVVALLAGLAMSTWQYLEKSRAYQLIVVAKQEEHRLREEAEKARSGETAQRTAAERSQASEALLRHEAQARSYAADMNLVQRSLELNNLGRATDLLNRYRPAPGQTDWRQWEWRYLWQQCRSDALYTLREKGEWIGSIAISHDSKWLVIADREQNGLRLWDFRKRKEISPLFSKNYVSAMAFAPGESILGAAVATGIGQGNRYTFQLWDVSAGRLTKELPLDAPGIGVGYSPDGKRAVVVTQKSIASWDLAGGTNGSQPFESQSDGIPYIADIDQSLSIAALGFGQGLLVLDLSTGRKVWSQPARDRYYTGLAFSPDSKWIASTEGYIETKVIVRDARTGADRAVLEGHGAYILKLAFSPDGKTLASVSADQTIRLWDTETWTSKGTLRGHRLEIWAVAWTADSNLLVSGSKDGAIKVWESAPVHRVSQVTLPEKVVEWKLRPDGKSVLTVNHQGQLAQWDGDGFGQRHTIMDLGSGVTSVDISPDGQWMAACLSNRFVQLWDIPKRALVNEFSPSADEIELAGFRATNRLLFVYPRRLQIKVISVPDGKEVASLAANQNDQAAAVSPDGSRCVLFTGGGKAREWRIESQQATPLELSFRMPGDAAFSPDGKTLALACKFGFARLWDTATWKETATFSDFLKGVHSVAWTPDGRRLAVGSGDKEAIKIWDMENKEEVLTLEANAGILSHSAFSADGSLLGALDEKGGLHLWRAPTWAEIEAAEQP